MLFIARRYLLSHKSHSVVNIIAGVSLISLLLPVAAVIVLLSIFNGFGAMIESVEGAVEGDVTVRLRDGKFFDARDIDTAQLRNIKGVSSLSFITEQTILLEHKGSSAVVILRGVDEEYTSALPIEKHIYVGEWFQDDNGIIIGNQLASQLGVKQLRGSKIELYALRTGRLQSLTGIGSQSSVEAQLTGIVSLDQDYESRYAYSSQRLTNELIGREGVASRIAIALNNSDIKSARSEIERVVGERFRVESRSELNPAIHQMVRYEKMGVLLICSFVMLLASFSLIGALTMLIIEKSREVVTLRAMGATHRDIKRIFLLEGSLISGVAIVGGTILGVGMTLIQQHFELIKLPSSSLVAKAYPVVLRGGDIINAVVVATVISMSVNYLVVKIISRKRVDIK